MTPDAGTDAPRAFEFEAATTETLTSLVRRSAPRLARDGLAPVLVFYVAWRLLGLWVGIACASAVSFWNWKRERRRRQPGTVAGISLLFLVLQAIQAVIGLVTGSVTVYLAQSVIVSGVTGIVFVISVLAGRPLAAYVGQEFYPFPPVVRESETFRRVFARISLVWGLYLVSRCVARLVVLLTGHIGLFMILTVASGTPATALLMTWSLWHGIRGFRRSAEWGPRPAVA